MCTYLYLTNILYIYIHSPLLNIFFSQNHKNTSDSGFFGNNKSFSQHDPCDMTFIFYYKSSYSIGLKICYPNSIYKGTLFDTWIDSVFRKVNANHKCSLTVYQTSPNWKMLLGMLHDSVLYTSWFKAQKITWKYDYINIELLFPFNDF